MHIPSYLVKNRFGTFYFQLVFPKRIRNIFNKKEARRSLKTKNRTTAIIMAKEFRTVAEQQLFPEIVRNQMNWIETKQFLDKIAKKLYEKYVNQVHQVGFDFHDRDSLDVIMPGAEIFIGVPPTHPTSALHFEEDKKEFEDRYHQTKPLTDFVDGILETHDIEVDQESDDYKRICKQAVEMLHRLDNDKRQYRNDLTTGSRPIAPYDAKSGVLPANLHELSFHN